MNHERRRLLVSAALASAALCRPAPLRSAEVEAQPGTAPKSLQGDAGGPETVLEAQVRPPGLPGVGQGSLAYGGTDSPRVLRIKRGELTRGRLLNHLPEPTSLEWHGMRLPYASATTPGPGGALLAPGGAAEFALNPPDSGTYWFHPEMIPGLSDQTSRGLAGVVVVEEPDAPPVDADKVLCLSEAWAGDPDPKAPAPAEAGPGLVLVNGKEPPERDTYVPGARLRLRLVNASTRQALAASFRGARALVIAIDGQPSELFRPLNDTVPIGPGARFDMMVDLPRTSGAEFEVRLGGQEPGPASASTPPVYLARTEGIPAVERPPMAPLPPNPALPRSIPLERATRADLVATQRPGAQAGDAAPSWEINGANGRVLAKRPLFSVKRNTPVTLGFSNKSPELTGFRLHGHVMRLLHAMDDGWEPYWRDSVLVPPGATHHAAFLADNPGRWLIDSSFFARAAAGLRTWFEVT